MDLDSEIIIVSGLPRSGTSLMMQMLHAGGVPVVTDHVRTADVDNPRGYFEFESAKQIEKDTSWLPATRGKALKMVSQLLYHLPPTERYQIIFMQRNLDEILVSQEKMLQRRNVAAGPREQMKEAFTLHLDRLFEWLHEQQNIQLLVVHYNELVDDSRKYSETVNEFLGNMLSIPAMVQSVDPSLYRNRNTPAEGH